MKGWLPWKLHGYRSYLTIEENTRSASWAQLKEGNENETLEEQKGEKGEREREKNAQKNLSSRGSMLRRSPVLISEMDLMLGGCGSERSRRRKKRKEKERELKRKWEFNCNYNYNYNRERRDSHSTSFSFLFSLWRRTWPF